MLGVSTPGRRTSLGVFDHHVAVAPGGREPIEVLDSLGNLVREYRLSPGAVSFSDASLRSAADDFLGRIPDRETRDLMIRRLLAAQHPKVDVEYRKAMYGLDGLLRIQRSVAGEPTVRLEVIDETEAIVGRAALRSNGDLIAVGRNQVAHLVTKNDGTQLVRVFEFTRHR